MMRSQRPWTLYSHLIQALGDEAGQPILPSPGSDTAPEQVLLDRFSQRLTRQHHDPAAEALLERLGISVQYYRQHLRYIGSWDPDSRRLLAAGASLRLLEDSRAVATQGKLVGLVLSGTVPHQRQQLTQHLEQFHPKPTPMPERPGWLAPTADSQGRSPGELKPIWIYPSENLVVPNQLHPVVARSLIAKYLPRPGRVVVDPMAGSGIVALEASRMGHRAFASDLSPGADFVTRHNLERRDLECLVPNGVADLLVLHPPLRGKYDKPSFEGQISSFIENAAACMKLDSLAALIVSTDEAPVALQSLTKLLVEMINPDWMGKKIMGGLVAHHLAVARDGSQAWHILVARNGPGM